MHGWYEVLGSWGHVLMGLSTVVFWALIIVAFVLLVRYAVREGHRDGEAWHKAAEQTLGERFARGEIDAEEYQDQLRMLRSATGQSH
ncbi:hypothetical protein CDO52_16655 [Nocardiopsis gilva YIM 90087]|uniref:SHOCT domain-containing protein n=1 Tax=Nocardiopsis gilva YIM 90087 TaxID=1235441 RepID=A0A223S7W4_9ACTN|nr:hypothetical protein [Nocardiopsis gilva]ASU84204.1 hypothetical protein CDO52_16655 [Nocardiopsis gilva YIM 90087]